MPSSATHAAGDLEDGHPHRRSRRAAALGGDTQDLAEGFRPALKQLLCNAAAGFASVLLQQVAHQRLLFAGAILQQIGLDKLWMKLALSFEGMIGVPNVSDATGHARSEVSACGSQNDDDPARHVLAGVFAHSFDDRRRS